MRTLNFCINLKGTFKEERNKGLFSHNSLHRHCLMEQLFHSMFHFTVLVIRGDLTVNRAHGYITTGKYWLGLETHTHTAM